MRMSVIVAAGACALAPAWVPADAPKNVILFIGDGMGHEAVKASGYYFNGASGQFNFEQFDGFAWMTHNNSSGGVTDSAASATAMSTGYKVDSNVLSLAYASGTDPRSATPNDGHQLTTLLELFKGQGKSTGLVTNSFMTDATPGAFGSHAQHRSDTGAIASGYFNQTQPNVLFGGGGSSFTPTGAYTTVTSRTQLQAIDTESATHVAGVFGPGQFEYVYDQEVAGTSTFYNANPYLHEMTESALRVLDNNTNGFFLMVENELTDAAGHAAVSGANKVQRSIYEVRELSRAVQKAIDFAATHPDTLILVTADHETGSFNTIQNNGQGVMPTVVSGSTSHNATWAPLYASGPNAGHVFGKLDNTDIPLLATTSASAPVQSLQTQTFRQDADSYAGVTDTFVRSDLPAAVNGSAQALLADIGGPTSQIAIRFEDLFGPAGIPENATIVLAKLSVYTTNGSNSDGTNNSINLNRLLVPFDPDSTWNSAGLVAGNGFSLNGAGAADDDYIASPEDIFPAPERGAVATFDVTESLLAWLAAYQAGEAHSFGWLLTTSSTDGWQIHSTDAAQFASRPMLEITFIPEPATLALPAIATAMLVRRRRCN